MVTEWLIKLPYFPEQDLFPIVNLNVEGFFPIDLS
jgi:hypothetical protein